MTVDTTDAPKPTADRSGIDRLGIGVSVTCAVHCVIASGLALAPALGGHALGMGVGHAMEWLELPLLIAALVIGLWALIPGYLRDHREPMALGLFLGGVALLAASRVVDTSFWETSLSVAGVGFVAAAHATNLRAHAAHHRAHGVGGP